LEQNVTVYVSPLAPEDAARTFSITFPRIDARGGAAATRPRWTAGFDPRGLRSRRADSAAAELSVNADIRAVRGAGSKLCIEEDGVTKHVSDSLLAGGLPKLECGPRSDDFDPPSSANRREIIESSPFARL